MKCLLLVAHGSRRAASNEEVRALAVRLAAHVNAAYAWVGCAFLELAEPSIGEGLRQAIQAGAREVMVLPYFLSAGRHVVSDIPYEVAAVRAEYPEVNILVAEHLGAAPGVVELLAAQAGEG